MSSKTSPPNNALLGNIIQQDTHLIVLVCFLVRWFVSLWGYSGRATPKMYGDYEAQRHWMEITTNLPIGNWYRQTPDNNLLYWGLDYPPLTAYVSWFWGIVCHVFEPDSVALFTSRGYETETSKG
jgi:alpha-1,3-glucosyltransferase